MVLLDEIFYIVVNVYRNMFSLSFSASEPLKLIFLLSILCSSCTPMSSQLSCIGENMGMIPFIHFKLMCSAEPERERSLLFTHFLSCCCKKGFNL